MNIIFTGMMGSGKTTIGKELAKLTGYEFIDTDAIIEKEQNIKIVEIFSKYGEGYFRTLENELVKKISLKDNSVISLGGGAFCNQDNISILKNTGFTIYLKTSIENILNRLSEDEIKKRPLLKDLNNFNNLLEKREVYYNQAHLIISTDNKSINEIINEILTNKQVHIKEVY